MAGKDKGGKGKRNDEHLPIVHLVFSNLKGWLAGTHHGVSPQHLQAYLNEFTFRFNRRFYPMVAFNSVLGIASHVMPPTYDALYSGAWTQVRLTRGYCQSTQVNKNQNLIIVTQPDRQGSINSFSVAFRRPATVDFSTEFLRFL